MDPLVDGMVCSFWLKMSLTGEERGEGSDWVVRAAGEDGAENCGVIYVFETKVFWRGEISNWIAISKLMPDVLGTCDVLGTNKKSAGVSTTDEKKRCHTIKKSHWDARTPCVQWFMFSKPYHFWRGEISNWTAILQLMPDVLVTKQKKSAGVGATDEKKRYDTHARRVCMPLCTASCVVKQSLASTR